MSVPPDKSLHAIDRAKTLSILVPAFNEEGTIAQALDAIASVNLPVRKEIVIVDDASTDGTPEAVESWIARHPEIDVRLLRHGKNQGKGAAIRTALAAASGQIIVIQDADLEYHPADYPALIEPILAGQAEVVYGSRFAAASHCRPASLRQWLANRFLTTLTNLLCMATLTDMETCYKAFRADVLRKVNLKSSRFEVEPEITVKLLRKGLSIHEVPISYRGRSRAQGKKISWRDGIQAVLAIIRYRLTD